MLLEHALLLHEQQIVGLKGIWVDPNKDTHEARVLDITRNEDGGYRITLQGLWGERPVSINQTEDGLSGESIVGAPHPVQFGSLILKVDHFMEDPMEWLVQSGIDLTALQKQSSGMRTP